MSTYPRFHPGKYSLFLDWETSGADFDKGYDVTFKRFQGLQVGLIIADNSTFEEVETLKLNIKFNGSKYEWQDGAEKIHGLSREWLDANGVTQEEAAEEVLNLLIKYFGDEVLYMLEVGPKSFSKKVCIGGHNVRFDIAALKQLLASVGFCFYDHHVLLDTSTIGFLAIGEYKSDKVFEFFGAEKRGSHDALDDARFALQAARGVKQLINHALGL